MTVCNLVHTRPGHAGFNVQDEIPMVENRGERLDRSIPAVVKPLSSSAIILCSTFAALIKSQSADCATFGKASPIPLFSPGRGRKIPPHIC